MNKRQSRKSPHVIETQRTSFLATEKNGSDLGPSPILTLMTEQNEILGKDKRKDEQSDKGKEIDESDKGTGEETGNFVGFHGAMDWFALNQLLKQNALPTLPFINKPTDSRNCFFFSFLLFFFNLLMEPCFL